MRIVIVTAGGAGMFCGSCMHDNTWARALQQAGHDVVLLPLYTPLTLDEESLSDRHVYVGGINVYLDARFPLWRRLPRVFKRWLDAEWILRLASRGNVSNSAPELGDLTLSLLQGDHGPHRAALEDLNRHLLELKPDVVCFSNLMLGAGASALRSHFPGKIWCVLQGDDIFLDALPEPWRTRAWNRLREITGDFDGYITHSDYYRQFMGERLNLPDGHVHLLPLTIDCSRHAGTPKRRHGSPPTVGYFARIDPAKGLDLLVEAVVLLQQEFPDVRLRAGGYLGASQRGFLDRVRKLAAPLGDRFEYLGSPATLAEKVAFLEGLDVFSVPTRYHEPKGIFLLEAWANGVPVVQPAHGAFPELVRSTRAGLLVTPDDPAALAEGLARILRDAELGENLSAAGAANVRRAHDLPALAAATTSLWSR